MNNANIFSNQREYTDPIEFGAKQHEIHRVTKS